MHFQARQRRSAPLGIRRPRLSGGIVLLLVAALPGCGTTRWSDTTRTATEQMVLSAAIDRAINQLNFKPLAGKKVFFDPQYLAGITDQNYIVSSLMQHMLSYGCVLKEKRDDADYIVVARAGAVGTNRHDVMLGVPSVNLPAVGGLTGVPSAIPEIPFAKSTEQTGLAKIAIFAYNRTSGQAYWQSGLFPVATNAKDTWIFGTGPFQRGSIYEGTKFAGSHIMTPFRGKPEADGPKPAIPVAAEAVFEERPVVVRKPDEPGTDNKSASLSPAGGSPAADGIALDAPTVVEPAEEYDVAPAGHIMRLPPLEAKERPDLAPLLQPPPHEPPAQIEPDAAIPIPPTDEVRAGFDLFRPHTWFGGLLAESRSEGPGSSRPVGSGG